MQNNPVINKENINRFLCPSCAANMVFDATSGKLLCQYCGAAKEIAADGRVDERDFYSFIKGGNQMLQPMAENAMQVNCSSCGAIVQFTPPATATECAFCGGKIVAQPKSADPLIAPEGVLPFRVPDRQANEGLKKWISSRWFAPSKLKDLARPEKLSSIYIPYWTYDAYSESTYSGERGEYYYQTEYYEENGEQKSRQVRYTNWYPTSGRVERQFDDITVPATKSLSKNYLDELEPWDLAELKSYEPAFLSGHKAQTYQVALPEGYEFFKQFAANVIYSDAARDIGGDEQRVHDVQTNYSNITFKHLLLPIYAGAYNFNNKVFQIVINGRTGEVQGERPYSWIKITLFVGFLLIIVLVFIAIAGSR